MKKSVNGKQMRKARNKLDNLIQEINRSTCDNIKCSRALLRSSIEGRHRARPLARIHSMGFEL